ncbi:MAG: hypothetical protein KAJ29_03480 [Alphaproteobacteria bacterium]|nr:hypothetical protein [Alphaproteobacteria bacterium]
MPRSNHKTTYIHLLLLTAFALVVMSAPQILHAQEQDGAANDTFTDEETKEKDSSETTNSTLADLIKSEQENRGKMHTKNWDTTKYQKKVAKEKEQEETGDSEEENSVEEKDDDELTESDKIWNHYSDLAQRNKTEKEKKKKEPKDEDKTEKEDETEDEYKTEKEDKKSEQKQSGGITEILERYKESQKKQGPMNSRSYGSID